MLGASPPWPAASRQSRVDYRVRLFSEFAGLVLIGGPASIPSRRITAYDHDQAGAPPSEVLRPYTQIYDVCIMSTEERSVTRGRLVAAIWLVSTALGAVIIILFRRDAPGQAALTTGLAIAGAVVAVWLLARPSYAAIAASTLLGVTWLVAYTALAVIQSGSPAAMVTDAFLAAAGTAAAGLSWTARARHRR